MGERNGTGLCALNTDGIMDSTRLRTLHDIVDWVKPFTEGDCIVAIDAPLIVGNRTGCRPCERLISRCFGRYHASAHSSNLGNRSFRTGGRARELAERLELDTDPHFGPGTRVRRAIEVYPHTALVALFDLPLILKYKSKRGRTAAARQIEFALFVSLLESLSAVEPAMDVRMCKQWPGLVRELATATTGAALDRAEDELDGYVCAYIGLYYWTYGVERCRVLGDAESGYIVTPVSQEQGAFLDSLQTSAG
jgi:predicted RNase H-like nuclease